MNKINLSPEALNDLKEIKEYISFESQNADVASNVVNDITKKIRLLEDNAYIGANLSTITGMKSMYRYLVCGEYMCFYRVKNDTEIFVDRILHSRRNYMRVLFK